MAFFSAVSINVFLAIPFIIPNSGLNEISALTVSETMPPAAHLGFDNITGAETFSTTVLDDDDDERTTMDPIDRFIMLGLLE